LFKAFLINAESPLRFRIPTPSIVLSPPRHAQVHPDGKNGSANLEGIHLYAVASG
jgi:hypothetical protein